MSDGLWLGVMAFPFVVDTLLVAGLQDRGAAWQLLIVNGGVTTFSTFLSQILERTTGRTRPFVQECGKNAGYKAMGPTLLPYTTRSTAGLQVVGAF